MAKNGHGSEYDREDEAKSMAQLALTAQEDAAAEARKWAERLLAENISLRDQSRLTILRHVSVLYEYCVRLVCEKVAIQREFEAFKREDLARARRQYNALRKAEFREKTGGENGKEVH